MKTEGLLLDTCAVIWMAQDMQLATAAADAIDAAFDAGSGFGVSAITAWELGLLGRRNRLPAPVSPLTLFQRFVDREGVWVEAVNPAILIDSSYLPGDFHSDPADRIIIATARHHDLAVVTRDRAILRYAQQGYVRALEC